VTVKANILGLCFLALAGCRPGDTATQPTSGGRLEVQWAGVSSRRFAGSAQAYLCRRDTLLEVLAARADTGVGLVFVLEDSLRPGQYPVTSSAVGATWRPAGLAAIRWVNDTAVQGLEANQGQLILTEVTSAGVSGTVDVRLKHLDTPDTVRMTGRFDAVAVQPAPDSVCGRIKS